MSRRQFYILVSILGICMIAFFVKVSSDSKKVQDIQNGSVELGGTFYTAETTAKPDIVTQEPVITEEPLTDPDNTKYPFNTMSMDWGAELYESGFVLYEIPEEYKQYGGCFPEVVQAYLWEECKSYGINYYMVVALIERESSYKWDMTGDNGNSKGYMQIYEKWHKDRMQAEGVTDLYNPYQNIRVGLSYLQEIQDNYLESSGENCVLMVYNMGETTAKKNWSKGIYSTEYSRAILSRAQEIKQEIQD